MKHLIATDHDLLCIAIAKTVVNTAQADVQSTAGRGRGRRRVSL